MTEPNVDLFSIFERSIGEEPLVEMPVPQMTTADIPAAPVTTAKPWSWDGKSLTYVGVGLAGVALSVWFVMAYMKWSKEGSHEHGDSGTGNAATT